MDQNKLKTTKIWVLVDDRPGKATQGVELAKGLGERFELKYIKYNVFANLPNCFLSFFPLHVKKSVLSQLKHSTIPEIIISSGRRAASLAVYLKRISGGDIKIIQIMRPDINPKEFHFIILPQHDSFSYSAPNVIRILGALTGIRNKLCRLGNEFETNYPDLKEFIAVIIGGSKKDHTLTLKNLKILGKRLSIIAGSHSLPFFISFGRRVPVHVKKYFKENFSWPNIVYDSSNNDYNPYYNIMQKAKYIISTLDSISICSESANTGKPVYVFCPDGCKLKKHKYFLQQLVDLGMIKYLAENTNHLEHYSYSPLSELDRIIKIIKNETI